MSSSPFSQEFCFHQNLISLKECFPGRVAISNEEFAGFLGICPATASRNRKAGRWPRTLDVGKKLAGEMLLVEAARWLTTFVRTAPPEPPKQPESIIIQLGDTILDYISQSHLHGYAIPDSVPTPQPPARTGKRGRPKGSRNKPKDNAVWNHSHCDM